MARSRADGSAATPRRRSWRNTLRINSAQLIRDDFDGVASLASSPQPLRAASGALGTIRLRQAAFGASGPWYLSW